MEKEEDKKTHTQTHTRHCDSRQGIEQLNPNSNRHRKSWLARTT